MKKESYEKLLKAVRSVKNGAKILYICGKCITVSVAACYAAALAKRVMERQYAAFWLLVSVPAASFLLVSIFRSLYNAKRPYEVYGFTPLIPKDTVGKSFPSRHVFSDFVIGAAVFFYEPAMAAYLFAAGTLLAVIRVVTGVHFPRDVLAGAFFGAVCGLSVGLFL